MKNCTNCESTLIKAVCPNEYDYCLQNLLFDTNCIWLFIQKLHT